jgi:hypothetical protein
MGVFKMSIQKKQNSDLADINVRINNMIFDAICKIGNGSITIIKQDKIVIQINVSEKINFDQQTENESFAKEAVL